MATDLGGFLVLRAADTRALRRPLRWRSHIDQTGHEEAGMNARTEGMIAMAVAVLVPFCSMWDPRASVVVSVAALTGFGVHRFARQGKS